MTSVLYVMTICVLMSATCFSSEKGRPRVLLALYDKKEAIVLEPDARISWRHRVGGSCQDAWDLGPAGILLSGGREVRKVNAKGVVVWRYTAPVKKRVEIHNCQPLPDGGVLIAEGGTNRILELDATGAIVKEVKTSVKGGAHGEFRCVRKTDRGTYLICAKAENTIYELDDQGKELRKITAGQMRKQGILWKALHFACELPNGNLFVGGGYDSSFCEIDKSGKVVWRLENKNLPTIDMTYCAGAQVLADGIYVLALYNSSHKIIAITRKKELLWSVTADEFPGKPTHVFVLGGKRGKRLTR